MCRLKVDLSMLCHAGFFKFAVCLVVAYSIVSLFVTSRKCVNIVVYVVCWKGSVIVSSDGILLFRQFCRRHGNM